MLDFCELNKYIDAYTAHADIYAQKLREWRKKGSNMSVLDLQRVYLCSNPCGHTRQLSSKKRGTAYLELNVAPSILRAIVEVTLSKDDAVRPATLAYIDDVFINEDIASTAKVRKHLANFGLVSKEPERLQNGARVFGLTVQEEGKMLMWERGNNVPSMPRVFT